MTNIRPLIPLLLAAGILLAGNGLQGTLIAIRGDLEGFSPTLIGLMGTTYYFGFLIGCMYVPRLLQSVGHIRTFAALAAIAASTSLALVLIVEPVTWIVIRFLSGLCFSGLFTSIDSWLNARATNENRGHVLSIYRTIDIFAVTGSQYLLPLFGSDGFSIFAIMAMMICLSLVPVSIADRSSPEAPAALRLDLGLVWRISPLACLAGFTIGLTNSAFRLVGPIYAQEIGFSPSDVATFMSAGILGGAVLQYPLGRISDRIDRRYVLMASTTGAVLSALAITLVAGTDPTMNFVAIFLFGAFSLPLYSLAAAHANDHAAGGQFVQISAGLLFFFSLGAMMGPAVSAYFVEFGGPSQLFNFISAIHASLIFITIYRISRRAAAPVAGRRGFAVLLRTSLPFHWLARGRRRPDGRSERPSAEDNTRTSDTNIE